VKRIALLLAFGSIVAGCGGAFDAHLAGFYAANGGVAGSSPTPSPTSGPVTTGCGTGTSTTTSGSTVLVLMSEGLTLGSSSAGAIAGFLDNAVPGVQSQPVIVTVTGTTPPPTIQFFNAEAPGSAIVHSAAAVTGSSFPTTFAFDPGEQVAEGTVIAQTGWSTGPVNPQCYSRTFSVTAAGTFLFGDLQLFSSTSVGGVGMRGVISAQ
jgi:hypothetical protein